MKTPESTDTSSGSGGSRPRWRALWRIGMFVVLLLVLAVLFGTAWALVRAWVGGLSGEWLVVFPAAAGAAVASWLMMSRVEATPFAALGLLISRRSAVDFVRGLGVGLVLVGAVIGVMVAVGWVSWDGSAGSWVTAMLAASTVLVVAAFWEELVFRGYPFQVLAETFGAWPAILVTAVCFAALHGANPGVAGIGLANTALSGVLLGVLYWRTYSLWFVTGAHFGWNWAMGIAADLPVSGLDLNASAVDAKVSGPDLITGGAYGPEGGLLLGLSVVLGITWALRTGRLSRDPAIIARGPLPERRSRRENGGLTRARAHKGGTG